jgi:hypothetical protein
MINEVGGEKLFCGELADLLSVVFGIRGSALCDEAGSAAAHDDGCR